MSAGRDLPINDLTSQVISYAIEVHRQLGPGLLESAYEECLCYELSKANIEFERQLKVPVIYKEVHLDCGYKLDVMIGRSLVVELKCVEKLLPIHEAQLLTYLKLLRCKTGLLLNFHSVLLKDGIKRMVL